MLEARAVSGNRAAADAPRLRTPPEEECPRVGVTQDAVALTYECSHCLQASSVALPFPAECGGMDGGCVAAAPASRHGLAWMGTISPVRSLVL